MLRHYESKYYYKYKICTTRGCNTKTCHLLRVRIPKIGHKYQKIYTYYCGPHWTIIKWNLIGHKIAIAYLKREYPNVPKDLWPLIEEYSWV